MRALTELKKVCIHELRSFQECFVCFNNNPKFLLIHHHAYFDDSVVYKQFENSDIGRIQYYARLLDEIQLRPNNFTVLCFKCHEKLEELIRMDWNDAYNWLNGEEVWTNQGRLETLWEDCESVVQKRKVKAVLGLDEFFWS